MCISLVYIV